MSYRKRYDFSQPSADELIENRRKMMWLYGLYFLQTTFWLFDDGDFDQMLLNTVLWTVLLVTFLWVLVGPPMYWLSERDRAKMDDEWNRYVTGDACKWGMAALGVMTIGASFLSLWYVLDSLGLLYSVANAAVFTALCRLAWLSRDDGEAEE
jgi:hypothetical protein